MSPLRILEAASSLGIPLPPQKPFQGKELLARVNIHLQLGKMRIELERRVEERTRALIESEMRYRGLADRYSTLSLLSPVGIFMADAQGKVNCAYRIVAIARSVPPADPSVRSQMPIPSSTASRAATPRARCLIGVRRSWTSIRMPWRMYGVRPSTLHRPMRDPSPRRASSGGKSSRIGSFSSEWCFDGELLSSR